MPWLATLALIAAGYAIASHILNACEQITDSFADGEEIGGARHISTERGVAGGRPSAANEQVMFRTHHGNETTR